MHGFCTAQDSDDQPFSSYCRLMGDASSDFLANIDDCISSLSTGMLSKNLLKLLPYLGARGRWYYCVERREVILYRTLPQAITEFGSMKSFENLSKTDMVFSANEVEGLEAITKTLLEVTSLAIRSKSENEAPLLQVLGISFW